MSLTTEIPEIQRGVVHANARMTRSICIYYSVIDSRLRIFYIVIAPAAIYLIIRLIMVLASPLFAIYRKLRS